MAILSRTTMLSRTICVLCILVLILLDLKGVLSLHNNSADDQPIQFTTIPVPLLEKYQQTVMISSNSAPMSTQQEGPTVTSVNKSEFDAPLIGPSLFELTSGNKYESTFRIKLGDNEVTTQPSSNTDQLWPYVFWYLAGVGENNAVYPNFIKCTSSREASVLYRGEATFSHHCVNYHVHVSSVYCYWDSTKSLWVTEVVPKFPTPLPTANWVFFQQTFLLLESTYQSIGPRQRYDVRPPHFANSLFQIYHVVTPGSTTPVPISSISTSPIFPAGTSFRIYGLDHDKFGFYPYMWNSTWSIPTQGVIVAHNPKTINKGMYSPDVNAETTRPTLSRHTPPLDENGCPDGNEWGYTLTITGHTETSFSVYDSYLEGVMPVTPPRVYTTPPNVPYAIIGQNISLLPPSATPPSDRTTPYKTHTISFKMLDGFGTYINWGSAANQHPSLTVASNVVITQNPLNGHSNECPIPTCAAAGCCLTQTCTFTIVEYLTTIPFQCHYTFVPDSTDPTHRYLRVTSTSQVRTSIIDPDFNKVSLTHDFVTSGSYFYRCLLTDELPGADPTKYVECNATGVASLYCNSNTSSVCPVTIKSKHCIDIATNQTVDEDYCSETTQYEPNDRYWPLAGKACSSGMIDVNCSSPFEYRCTYTHGSSTITAGCNQIDIDSKWCNINSSSACQWVITKKFCYSNLTFDEVKETNCSTLPDTTYDANDKQLLTYTCGTNVQKFTCYTSAHPTMSTLMYNNALYNDLPKPVTIEAAASISFLLQLRTSIGVLITSQFVASTVVVTIVAEKDYSPAEFDNASLSCLSTKPCATAVNTVNRPHYTIRMNAAHTTVMQNYKIFCRIDGIPCAQHGAVFSIVAGVPYMAIVTDTTQIEGFVGTSTEWSTKLSAMSETYGSNSLNSQFPLWYNDYIKVAPNKPVSFFVQMQDRYGYIRQQPNPTTNSLLLATITYRFPSHSPGRTILFTSTCTNDLRTIADSYPLQTSPNPGIMNFIPELIVKEETTCVWDYTLQGYVVKVQYRYGGVYAQLLFKPQGPTTIQYDMMTIPGPVDRYNSDTFPLIFHRFPASSTNPIIQFDIYPLPDVIELTAGVDITLRSLGYDAHGNEMKRFIRHSLINPNAISDGFYYYPNDFLTYSVTGYDTDKYPTGLGGFFHHDLAITTVPGSTLPIIEGHASMYRAATFTVNYMITSIPTDLLSIDTRNENTIVFSQQFTTIPGEVKRASKPSETINRVIRENLIDEQGNSIPKYTFYTTYRFSLYDFYGNQSPEQISLTVDDFVLVTTIDVTNEETGDIDTIVHPSCPKLICPLQTGCCDLGFCTIDIEYGPSVDEIICEYNIGTLYTLSQNHIANGSAYVIDETTEQAILSVLLSNTNPSIYEYRCKLNVNYDTTLSTQDPLHGMYFICGRNNFYTEKGISSNTNLSLCSSTPYNQCDFTTIAKVCYDTTNNVEVDNIELCQGPNANVEHISNIDQNNLVLNQLFTKEISPCVDTKEASGDNNISDDDDDDNNNNVPNGYDGNVTSLSTGNKLDIKCAAPSLIPNTKVPSNTISPFISTKSLFQIIVFIVAIVLA